MLSGRKDSRTTVAPVVKTLLAKISLDVNLSKYLELVKIGFKEASAYRLDAATGLASSVLFIVLYYYVWGAITASGTVESSLDQVMTYIVVAQIVSNAVFVSVEGFVGEKVRKGTIVNELKRPVSLFSQAYFRKLGEAFFRTLTRSLPIFLLGDFFLDVSLPSGLSMFFFAVSLFLGLNLVLLLSYATSMLVFWTKVEWSIRSMRNTVQRLFSGVLFPLYLLPGGLVVFFDFLPFSYMVDGPIQIFLMQRTGIRALEVLALQLVWVLLLFLLAHFAWSKAKKKLTVQGG